jgi:phosphoserine phosphatase RsbU/P
MAACHGTVRPNPCFVFIPVEPSGGSDNLRSLVQVAMATLKVHKGPNPGQEYKLDRDNHVMGRHPDCEIVLDVGAVSRQHARILRQNGSFYVEDLKSRNGTFVNDQLVEGQRQLKDQDEVKICDLVFKFLDQAQAISGTVDHVPDATEAAAENAMVIDDQEEQASSTIMSKLDVSTSYSGLRVTVNPEVKLRAMLEITQSLAKALSLEEVLPKILDSLFKVFVQADRGFIVMQDSPTAPLVPKAVKYRRAGSDDAVRISRTIVREAMTSKQAILSADAANDSRFGMSESIADFRIRSMMCAPMVSSDGKAMGIIQVDTLDQRTRFQQEDLEVLASVASQAAFAVENATLHETAMRQQAIERDLAVARKVQQGFLPHSAPSVENYEFFDFYVPANAVGGDYYDYVVLPDSRIGIIVADVSGKGIPAALLMAKVSAESKYFLASIPDPAKAIGQLNASFARAGFEDKFVTFLLQMLDTKDNTVTIVNAGHMPPFLRRTDATVEAMGEAEAGTPLGVVDDFEFEAFKFTLQPGESLTAFTDGISEAMNAEHALYEEQRVKQQLGVCASPKVADLGQHILNDVKEFVGKYHQTDDMCLVCFSRTA